MYWYQQYWIRCLVDLYFLYFVGTVVVGWIWSIADICREKGGWLLSTMLSIFSYYSVDCSLFLYECSCNCIVIFGRMQFDVCVVLSL